MKPEVAHRRIESFAKRFGEAHLVFAYHAAFPLALTPDLLYKLWANFQRDIHGRVLGIPWVAVADLLLSSLCDEVGHELYEMDAAMRNLLLSRLKENVNFGQQRINELSNFLLAYVQQQLNSVDPDVRDFAQVQRWTALAYVRPDQAARELALVLKETYQQDKAELLRLASLVETFAEPLAEFEPLLVYACGIKKIICGKWEEAVAEFEKAGISEYRTEIAGVSLNIATASLIHANIHLGLVLMNRYKVSQLLSDKGADIVYEVVDKDDKLKVLKIINLDSFSEPKTKQQLVSLFSKGAEFLASRPHPGIPRVDPDGYFLYKIRSISEPLHCLVMEKIQGLNLDKWLLNHGVISEKIALDWLKQLAEILQHLHKHRIVHRDIKPENIMLKPNGQLVLINFDIVGNERDGIAIVTEGYSPPEQYRGQSLLQSDFFSLGRTFVKLITNKHPCEFQVSEDTLKLIWRDNNIKISNSLGDLIDDMMAMLPKNRPQNAEVILQRVNAIKAEINSIDATAAEAQESTKSTINLSQWVKEIFGKFGK